jgi:hypothetical protein
MQTADHVCGRIELVDLPTDAPMVLPKGGLRQFGAALHNDPMHC